MLLTLSEKVIRKLRVALAPNANVTKEWLEAVVMAAKKLWGINLEMLASQMKALYRERKIWHVGMHTTLQKVWSSIYGCQADNNKATFGWPIFLTK